MPIVLFYAIKKNSSSNLLKTEFWDSTKATPMTSCAYLLFTISYALLPWVMICSFDCKPQHVNIGVTLYSIYITPDVRQHHFRFNLGITVESRTCIVTLVLYDNFFKLPAFLLQSQRNDAKLFEMLHYYLFYVFALPFPQWDFIMVGSGPLGAGRETPHFNLACIAFFFCHIYSPPLGSIEIDRFFIQFFQHVHVSLKLAGSPLQSDPFGLRTKLSLQKILQTASILPMTFGTF